MRKEPVRAPKLVVLPETTNGARMETFEVALIPIGEGRWAALLTTGQVIVSSTKNPRRDVAAELLLHGVDPRSRLIIRAGSKLIANDTLGFMGGSPVTCNDIGAIEKD